MRNLTWMAEHVVPDIDLTVCTGCGLCVELCPPQAVDLVNGQAVITRPAQCTFCEICESYCPVSAIGRPFLVMLTTPTDPSETAAALAPAPDPAELS